MFALGEEYTELWVLSLQPLCKYEIIPKLKLPLKKKKKVFCWHKWVERHWSGLSPCSHGPHSHRPFLRRKGAYIYPTRPERMGNVTGSLRGWGGGDSSTFIALEDKMCLQKQTIIIQKLKSVCEKITLSSESTSCSSKRSRPFWLSD